jgi:hypothetical protein
MDRIGHYRAPGYQRLFAQARKSLEGSGGDLSRSVTIRDPDDAETKSDHRYHQRLPRGRDKGDHRPAQ